MINIKYVIVLMCLLFFSFLHGQSKNKQLNGKVIAPLDSLQGIHVLNISQNSATTTDKYGNFTMSASLNDTLIFSAIQLQPSRQIITTEILEKKDRGRKYENTGNPIGGSSC